LVIEEEKRRIGLILLGNMIRSKELVLER